MAVYTQLSHEQIAAFLAQAYDVGALVEAQGIAQGVENTNYRLTLCDATGATQHSILTLYEQRVTPQDVPFFLSLMRHVAQAGAACPTPVVRRDGTLYGAVAGKMAALVSFLPGKSRTEWGVTQVAAVGEALAMLHRSTAHFSGTRANDLSLNGWQTLYKKTKDKLENIEHGLEKMLQHELQHLSAHWPVDLHPRGVIHADLFPDNVFFEGDRVSGMIDFYFACHDALSYDVAITLNAWCFEADWAFNPEKSRALLAAYQQIRPLTREEIAALPVLLRGAALRFLLTRAHDWIFRAPDALVTPHDPREYIAKLNFHQSVTDGSIYGAA